MVLLNKTYPKKINEGDLIFGIKSNGVHSNGYTLIHKILENNEYDLNELIKPTKIYIDDINYLKQKYNDSIKGFSHITGGGIIDNIPRILDKDYNIDINCKWDIIDVFKWIYNNSDMSETEMLKYLQLWYWYGINF